MKAWHSKVKLHGLTRRWILNVLSVVFAVFFVFTVAFALMIHEHFYTAVEQYLYDWLGSVTYYFDGTASEDSKTFLSSAREYVDGFSQQDLLEVQFLSSDGNIQLSTAGYQDDNLKQATDYQEALESEDHLALWQGKAASGESVMSVASIITARGQKDVCIGAVRVAVSLTGVNRQFRLLLGGEIGVVLVLFIIIVASGFYFIKSVVQPVQNVGVIARQIAMGEFDARIEETGRDDEIAALCQTINYMAGELASTEQMKNEFISSVSHELRTPLTAIKGWGETVADSMEDPEVVQKGMEVIIGEAERLSVIVEDLLDFSRMQNGKLTYHMQPCDAVAEMAEAILTLTDTAARKKVLLDFSEPDGIPPIIGDAGRLQQVFVNILGNALKYTPEEGSIVVDIKHIDGYLEIMISDTGCGIAPEDLDHIKQKFYKGKDAARGSGIGLAIADEIVTAHGGELTIASTLHVGTTVTVRLPVKPVVSEEESINEQ